MGSIMRLIPLIMLLLPRVHDLNAQLQPMPSSVPALKHTLFQACCWQSPLAMIQHWKCLAIDI
jgi:hypothetical protein